MGLPARDLRTLTAQERIEAMPDDGLIRASWAKRALDELRREAILLAASEEETIQMWVEMGTRYYCEGKPASAYSPAPERDESRDDSEPTTEALPSLERPQQAEETPWPEAAKSGPTQPAEKD